MDVIILISPTEKNDYECKRLVDKLESRRAAVRVLHPDEFDIVIGPGGCSQLYHRGGPLRMPDRVLVRMGSSVNDLDMAILRQFEQAGVRCWNSSRAIELARDKIRTYQCLSANGISVPRTVLIHPPANFNLIKSEIGFPCVIKINVGSYGAGVYLCSTREELVRMIEFIDYLGVRETILVQEYIKQPQGGDIRSWVIGDWVGGMRRLPTPGDFRASNVRPIRIDRYREKMVQNAATVQPIDLTEGQIEVSRRAARLLGLDIASFDLLDDPRGVRISEANANTGFRKALDCSGYDIAAMIVALVIDSPA